MQYFDYINKFYDHLQTSSVSSNAQLLYHTLLMIFNKAHWESELQRTNYSICSLCGIGEKALSHARNELKQLGLIDFTTDKRRGQATKYRLCTDVCTVKNAVQTQNKGRTKEEQTQNKGRTYKDIRQKKKEEDNITPISPKVQLAEFVSMTNAEYDALVERFGESDTKVMIEILDNYKGSSGRTYKSDYRAILSWVVHKLSETKKPKEQTLEVYHDDYDHTGLESLARRKYYDDRTD